MWGRRVKIKTVKVPKQKFHNELNMTQKKKQRSRLEVFCFQKTDKQEFSVNVVELMYLQEATWEIWCTTSAANMSWNIKTKINECSVVVNIVQDIFTQCFCKIWKRVLYSDFICHAIWFFHFHFNHESRLFVKHHFWDRARLSILVWTFMFFHNIYTSW